MLKGSKLHAAWYVARFYEISYVEGVERNKNDVVTLLHMLAREMMSLVNKSADWTPNYHKILIFSPPKSLKRLHAATIEMHSLQVSDWLRVPIPTNQITGI